MKTSKKQKLILPEIHVLGDLEDVKNLVSEITKKKAKMIFKNAEAGAFYKEIGGKIAEIGEKDLDQLEKKHRAVHYSFFPALKKAEPAMEQNPEVKAQEAGEMAEKKVKKEKKEKKDKKKK